MIELLLINSLAIIGFNLATEQGMVLHFIERYTSKMPEYITKPLWSCPYCMASVHSTYFFIPAIMRGQYEWSMYPSYILSLCGMTLITYNIARIVREYQS